MSPSGAAVKLKNGQALSLAQLPLLAYATFSEALLAAVAAEGRVAAYFALPAASPRLELYALIARDWQSDLLLLRTTIGERFPSLTPRCPQLQLFEREIAEQYGMIPEGHPWFKPVRFHAPWQGRDPWARPAGHPVCGVMDYYRVEGEEVHEVAVGPVHAGVIEPGHFRFQCHGEEVLHLEISLGYQHRGIEAALLGGPHPTTLARMETLAGDTSIGHASAYCACLEALAGVEISPRAAALRGIALELERLAAHVGDLGALAGDVGFLPTASFCGRLRGDYLNLSAELCGSRFGRGLVRPGGVGFDLEQSLSERIRKRLREITRDTRGAIALLFDSPSALARMEGVGKVAVADAEAMGLVGLAARACGLARDVRLHHSWGAYVDSYDHCLIEETGDVYARANLRRREINASLDWLEETLKRLPAGAVLSELPPLAPDSLAVALVEGWRGELVHIALTDGAGRFMRYKVVDPSFHNWGGLAMALRNEQISDFPLCNKSFNLSYCGFDL